MSAGASSMSFWIKFFSDAGIPVGVAANYAVIFTEQRIQQDMLLDLSKEYLGDMGINVLGDVIGILRHAKDVHTQCAREKALKASVTSSATPKRSTPASRTVSHYLRKDANLSPMNEPEVKTGPKISVELANRLGSSTPPETSKVMTKKISLRSQTEEVPVPKIRRVLPEHEGKYKVSMPKGTTEKTKKIMASKAIQEKSSSVFARLGQNSSSSSPTAKVTITGLDNVVLRNASAVTSTTSPVQSSVFKRLGGISETAVKRPASSTCPDSDDSEEDKKSTLSYAGILKRSSAEKREALLIKKKAIVLQRKKMMAQKKKALRVAAQKPEVTTSSEGILAQDLIMEKKSARSRLGKPTKASSTGIGQAMDFTISKDVRSRLSVQKIATVTSSPQISSSKNINLKRQTSASKQSKTITSTVPGKSGVFSRLGKPTS